MNNKGNNKFDETLIEIFRNRLSNFSEWTRNRCEEEFKRLTGADLSFRTMERRFSSLQPSAIELTNLRPVYSTASAQPDANIEMPLETAGIKLSASFSSMSIDEISVKDIQTESDSSVEQKQSNVKKSRRRKPLTLKGENFRKKVKSSQENLRLTRFNNAQAQARHRANLSVEDRNLLRESNAQQQVRHRENLSVEDRNLLRESNAQQQVRHRANLSVEDHERIRLENRIQHEQRLGNLTQSERTDFVNRNAQYQRNRRATLTQEQQDYERERNRVYISQQRENMTEEDREVQRYNNNMRRRTAYQAMTGRERLEFLGLRQAQQRRREATLPNYRIALDRGGITPTVTPYLIGGMDNECEHCGACYFNDELNSAGRFTLCCSSGKISIPKIENFHNDLVKLFCFNQNSSPFDREIRGHLLDNIRQYNSLLAFGGIRANFDPINFDNIANNRRNRGGFCYRVHGAMYFHVPPLYNDEEDEHRLQTAQFHIHDSDMAHRKRVEAWYPDNGQINEALLTRLENIINSVYPFHHILQNNRNFLRTAAQGEEATDCAMYITTRPTPNEGAPQTITNTVDHLPGGEIAAVFYGDDPPNHCSVAIHPRLNHRIRLNFRNPLVDSILFPLLFPHGELGYQPLDHARQTLVLNRTTLKEFYCFRLCIRKVNNSRFTNLLFQTGKLFQEYVCHCFMRIEGNDLNWQYHNQQALRVGDYDNVREIHQRTNPGSEPGDAGYPIILSSTFPGSVRNMRKHYFDTMSMARFYGKPDFFITFTTNPNRVEINNELPIDYAKYLNRPDICSRVFELTLKKFYDLMSKDHILGRMEANVGTREYQKTGLPHAHTAWWLEEGEKISTAADLDKYICAEIPNEDEEPELYALVCKYQLHGPCNGNRPCVRAGPTCAKGYPKDFQEHTEFIPGQFAKYRRRNNGRTVRKNGFVYTNQHVVPYNKFLLLFFLCHINIEYCALLHALAYLFKYMCKGADRINTSITGQLPNSLNTNLNPVQVQLDDPDIDPAILAQQERALNDYIHAHGPDADIIIPLNDNEPVIIGGQADATTAAFADILNEDLPNPIAENLQVVEEDYNAEEAVTDAIEEVAKQQPLYDEIRDFRNKRYVSSVEATDKIFGFSRVVSSHTVYTLKIHERNRQPVFHTTSNRQEALNRAETTDTMLTAFFKLNRDDPFANNLLYEQIPYHYVFNKGTWTPRQRRCDKTVARLQFIYPSPKEIFFLRLILQHVPGPTCWEDLLTVNGVQFNTFRQAAVALNLVENEQHIIAALEEALTENIHSQVRFLFAHILLHSTPVNPTPLDLWNEYSERMSFDYMNFLNDPLETALQRSLQHLKFLLENENKTLSDFNLPEPFMNVSWRYRRENINLLELTPEEYNNRVIEIEPTLNPEQNFAYRAIVDAIENKKRKNLFFIDGPAGTGKTYLMNLLLMKVASLNKICQPLAFTGIAASLIQNGQTIHSKFRLSIPSDETCTARIEAGSEQARKLIETDVFVLDECSQIDKYMLHAIDRCLRDVTGNRSLSFGGKCIILAGDFRQCLPVGKKSSNLKPEDICLKADKRMWKLFTKFSLVNNVRADLSADEFKQWCLKVGDGVEARLPNTNLINIPDQVISTIDLIEKVFGAGQITLEQLKQLNCAILCPTNLDSLEINELILERLEGIQEPSYFSTDKIQTTNDGVNYPLEHAYNETPNGYPPHKLNLKIGAIVILLKNWNIPLGLCNGTRMRVVKCSRHSLTCAIINGPRKDQEYTFSRVKFIPTENDHHRVERFQFPFRLAFAMTINKSQGQTFDRIGLLLKSPVFAHGQLYVAISRVRNFKSLSCAITNIDRGDKQQGLIDGKHYTQNIVNTKILK